MISITLRLIVLPFRVLGPINREPIAHEPIGKVNTVD
jgi:hypothetical protein